MRSDDVPPPTTATVSSNNNNNNNRSSSAGGGNVEILQRRKQKQIAIDVTDDEILSDVGHGDNETTRLMSTNHRDNITATNNNASSSANYVERNNNTATTTPISNRSRGLTRAHSYKKLKDFSAIDFTADVERARRKRIFNEPGLIGAVKRLWYRVAGWITLALVGATCGVLMAMVAVCGTWLFDIRKGLCTSKWWLPLHTCCQNDKDDGDDYTCSHWKPWSAILHVEPRYQMVFDYAIFFAFSILIGGLCAWFIKIFAPMSGHSGMAEIKTVLSGFMIPNLLGFRTLIAKVVGVILALGSGLIVGDQEPSVHIACSVGSCLSNLFVKYRTNVGKVHELMIACCAVGVAVTFNAPIGGVLFALENSSYFPPKLIWRSLFASIIGVVVQNVLIGGQYNLLTVPYDQPYHYFELVAFTLMGILGGLFGALFIKVAMMIVKFKQLHIPAISRFRITEVIIVCAVTAIISFPNSYLRLSTRGLLDLMLAECGDSQQKLKLCAMDWTEMVPLFVSGLARVLLLLFTFGLKVPTGLFIPCFCVGAIFGQIIGILFKNFQAHYGATGIFVGCQASEYCIIPGVYSMIGAAVTMASITRITVAPVIIIYEVVGGLQYLVPTMLSVLVAKWVGDALGRESIYDKLIYLNDYPYLDNKIDVEVEGDMGDMLAWLEQDPKDLVTICTQDHNTIGSLKKLLAEHNFSGYPVVRNRSNEMMIVGYIMAENLAKAIEDATKAAAAAAAARATTSTSAKVSKFKQLQHKLLRQSGLGGGSGRGRGRGRGNTSCSASINNDDNDTIAPFGPSSSSSSEPSIEVVAANAAAGGNSGNNSDSIDDDTVVVFSKYKQQHQPWHHKQQDNENNNNNSNSNSVHPTSSTTTRSRHHQELDFSSYMDKSPTYVFESTPIDRVYQLFLALKIRYCLVKKDGVGGLYGVITKRDCLEFIVSAVEEAKNNNNNSNNSNSEDSGGAGGAGAGTTRRRQRRKSALRSLFAS